ncbi:MAG: hypothetical protein A3K03_12755 [Bdellovibrionales bacterium RIFOXYD1_FULL_44_7]|nr:MAG: hypothetical protein A3K03_12755 [Bdellovibrionales bacterium RIFOXYD1_FULL_44_7]
MRLRKIVFTCLALFIVSEILLLINIQFPRGLNFDEFHYIPSARQFLSLSENQNWEHPPLAKILIASGIKLFGDRPFGWRSVSVFFGSLSLIGMFLWALALFKNYQTALFVALLTLVNNLLFVQSRIAMLDSFMFAFDVLALAAFTYSWRADIEVKKSVRLLAFAGFMFGFATASKWFGAVPWFGCLFLLLLLKVIQYWGTSFNKVSLWQSKEGFQDWYSPNILSGLRISHILLCLIFIPVLAYFITFIPFFFIKKASGVSYSLYDVLMTVPKMWEGQQRVVNTHPYMSNWYSWPLMMRPIWYAFDKDGNSIVRGVLMLGNPLIMWSGLLAVGACLWGWIARRSWQGFFILFIYVLFAFSWAVIPRKVAFYYYYFPAGMTLSLAIAFVFHNWETGKEFFLENCKWLRWAYFTFALALFIYFYPILAALRISSDSFRKWMWFTSWI